MPAGCFLFLSPFCPHLRLALLTLLALRTPGASRILKSFLTIIRLFWGKGPGHPLGFLRPCLPEQKSATL